MSTKHKTIHSTPLQQLSSKAKMCCRCSRETEPAQLLTQSEDTSPLVRGCFHSVGAPEHEPQLIKKIRPGALAMELSLLHPKLPGFVSLPALLQDCSAGAGPTTAKVLEPLNQVHWS